MGPPSYMWSVVDRNVVMLRMTVIRKHPKNVPSTITSSYVLIRRNG